MFWRKIGQKVIHNLEISTVIFRVQYFLDSYYY